MERDTSLAGKSRQSESSVDNQKDCDPSSLRSRMLIAKEETLQEVCVYHTVNDWCNPVDQASWGTIQCSYWWDSQARLIRYSHPTLCLSRSGSKRPFLVRKRHMIVLHKIFICHWSNNLILARRRSMSVPPCFHCFANERSKSNFAVLRTKTCQ